MGTDSFWEGIDVSGSNLTLLIIDKLPFPVPNDPILKQKSRMIIDRGQSILDFLPKALLSLKQGFGRLIRSESDRGLFVLGDPRMATNLIEVTSRKICPSKAGSSPADGQLLA